MNKFLDFDSKYGGIGFIKAERLQTSDSNKPPFECVTLLPANYLVGLLGQGEELANELRIQGYQLMDQWRQVNSGVTSLRSPISVTYPLTIFAKGRNYKTSKYPYSRTQKSRLECRLDTTGKKK